MTKEEQLARVRQLSEASLFEEGATITKVTLTQETCQEVELPFEYLDDFKLTGISQEVSYGAGYPNIQHRYQCTGMYLYILDLAELNEHLNNEVEDNQGTGMYFNDDVLDFLRERNFTNVGVTYQVGEVTFERSYSLPWIGNSDETNGGVQLDETYLEGNAVSLVVVDR